MKIVCIFTVFIAFLAVPAIGGEIWGIIRQDGKPQPGLSVKIFHNLSGKPSELKACKTDKFGLFSLFLHERGQYELKVFDDKDTEIYSRTIPSYEAPMRWDVHLIATPKTWFDQIRSYLW